MSNHHANNAEKNRLTGDLCHSVLDLCLHFAFALLKQDNTASFSPRSGKQSLLKRVHCILYVLFLSGWYLFRARLERTPECDLLFPILPLLMSSDTDIIVAAKVPS